MKFTTREQYGLRVVAELARHYGEGPLPLSQIAESEDLALPSLEQLMIPLRQAGLLHSVRGAHGGYTLARAPDAISIGDVMRALEGVIMPMPCLADDGCAPCVREDTCAARNVWELVHARLVEALDSLTLADLCPAQEPAPADD